MKKQVYIISAAYGKSTMSLEAKKHVKDSHVVIGEKRLTDGFSDTKAEFYDESSPEEIARIITNSKKNVFSVLFPGDVCFYGNAEEITQSLTDADIKYIPGISPVNYLFSKCELPWQEAKIINAQEPRANIIDAVRRNRFTFIIGCDKIRNLALSLCDVGFEKVTVYVGENLGTKREKVYSIKAAALCLLECSEEAVLIVDNPDADKRIRIGISSNEFITDDLKMLTPTICAVVNSKLQLREDSVCYCIGKGNTTLAVEMAMIAHEGGVYVFDENENSVNITLRNCVKFHIGNLKTIQGISSELFYKYAEPDAVFIGGANDKIDEIIYSVSNYSPSARFVLLCLSPQETTLVLSIFNDLGYHSEITQILASHQENLNDINIMSTDNPVYIITAQGKNNQE